MGPASLEPTREELFATCPVHEAAATYNVPPSARPRPIRQIGRVPYGPDMEKAPGPSGPEAGVVRVDQWTVRLPAVTIPAVVSDIG